MEQELHITGIVVYCAHGQLETSKSQIALVPSAEFHAESPDGKLIVTLETESTRQTLDYIDAIRAVPGVLDVSLVYQHAEPAAAMAQELAP